MSGLTAWLREFLDANEALIIERGAEWVISESYDLRGRRPPAETVKIVAQNFAAYRALLLDEPGADARLTRFIEFITTYRAQMNFRISTLLRGFLAFKRGIAYVMAEQTLPLERQQEVIDRVDELYFSSIFQMSDLYVDKLKEIIAERQRQLQDAHRKLMEVAHRAGMVEVTSDILHNVGNLLTSVNTSVSMMETNLATMGTDELTQIAALFDEHQGKLGELLSSERGAVLPSFLTQLAHLQTERRDELLHEAKELQNKLRRITDIIVRQHDHVSSDRLRMEVDVAIEIENALKLYTMDFEKHAIQIAHQVQPVPQLIVEPHKLRQIIINLLSNAVYALSVSTPPRTLTVGLKRHRDEILCIEIIDDGIGIAPEDMDHLFQYGFTNRPDSHGLGLHYCAVTAREMGGEIQAHSDGVGMGAKFVLRLPFRHRPPTADDSPG